VSAAVQAPAGQSAAQFEVVFGHRRLQACRELGLKVLAVVDALTDTELFVEMDRENRTRKDLSAWEQGAMYQRALDEGLFPSNRKLAEAVGVDLGNLGRALALARLPQEVVQAFASPLDLQFRWAKALTDAAATDRAGLVARAQALATHPGERAAKAVFEQLVAAPAAGGGLYRTTPITPALVAEPAAPALPLVIAHQGKPVAWLSVGEQGAVTLAMAPGTLAPERLAALARHIEAFLAQ
jgi:ParB family chromosome partitioning protein